MLLNWRPTTIDIDLAVEPESDQLLRELPALKDELQVNVERLTGALHSGPARVARAQPVHHPRRIVDFHHYDFYSQALAKIERGHDRDTLDVAAMAARGLIDPGRLVEFHDQIAPDLFRYPAIDPPSFRRAVEHAVRTLTSRA